jgi:hypothetical protein
LVGLVGFPKDSFSSRNAALAGQTLPGFPYELTLSDAALVGVAVSHLRHRMGYGHLIPTITANNLVWKISVAGYPGIQHVTKAWFGALAHRPGDVLALHNFPF